MKKLKPPGSGENIIKKQPETVHPVHNAKNTAQLKDLTYEEFKKIAGKTPFTLAEWASILHVSERTLQRYAKNNSTFSPINAERFFQISQVISRGKKEGRSVALTFEDAPDPEISPRLLELLRCHGAPATFFVTGAKAERYPELIRGILSH